MTPKLSISIVHHQGLQMLHDCLRSIYENTTDLGFDFEVIVVDNVSTDGAVDMMAKEFAQVQVIRNTERHGFGHNQNTGIKACKGEYIFVYNDDTLLHKNALRILCDFLDQNPQVGLVGPRLVNADGSLQMSCYKFPAPARYIWENLLLSAAFPDSTIFGDYRSWQHDTVREVDFVIGAAMLVRRAVIEQVGLFDERFFMYAEETDWQIRIKKAGWHIKLCPDSVVTHLGGQSSEGTKDRQFCEFNTSAVKLIQKHYGAFGTLVQRLAMIFGSIIRISIWSLVFVIKPAKRQNAEKNIKTWIRLLKWWCGFGPHEGLSSL
ncbi:MAG: glycosyltransferase family 2 protein [Cyanobacteria bacterium SZAS-4]|nr:glycosyltransferase family 2 protein [Cyanobacteria bacterium SZAS-4]